MNPKRPEVVEQRLIDYLSEGRVASGRAFIDAEELLRARQRVDVARKAIVEAWNRIVGAPDEMLVDLVAETTERICGLKPERDSIRQFLSGQVHAQNDVTFRSPQPTQSQDGNARPAGLTRRKERGSVLPISLDPETPADFLAALLRTKEAWLVVSYNDGREEVRRWDASRMTGSSNVIGNLRSRTEFRARNLAEKWDCQPTCEPKTSQLNRAQVE